MKIPFYKLLTAYSAAITTVLIGQQVSQAIGAPDKASFGEIDVQRINIRERDGTLRMVVSDRDRFPGLIWRNKDYPHTSRHNAAGILFFNDEGTENGGLTFGGANDGKVHSFGHLSFDQYEQDQVVTLEQAESDGRRTAGLTIVDRPDKSMNIPGIQDVVTLPEGPERTAGIAKLVSEGVVGNHPRVFLGKQDGASMLTLKDGDGHDRLRLTVSKDGKAAIEFVDTTGKVTKTVTP